MRKNGIDVIVEEVGVLVSKEKPFLGASIDRIVTFKDTGEKRGMEIKSPLRTVPPKYKGFCARLGPRGKRRYLKGLLESTRENWGSHAFFRHN